MSSIFKTGMLLAALTALLVAIGFYVGGRSGAILFFGFSLVMNVVSYWWSEKIALKMARAKLMDETQNSSIYSEVRALAAQLGIPAPKIYYTDDVQANAFATGRNPKNSSICLTKGIMNVLNKDELRGVIAHELAHIKNRDVLVSTVAAVMAGAISALAEAAFWFGGSDSNRNPAGTILMMILGPLGAMLIQFAISRQREFHADETGGKASRRPFDLANALRKIDESVRRAPMRVNPAISSLYIANPLRAGFLQKMFSTHPPVAERIRRLETMIP
jgi:heat shock protein HtpX